MARGSTPGTPGGGRWRLGSVAIGALVLAAVGAAAAGFLAAAPRIPTWIAVEIAVWLLALLVVGFTLLRVRRRFGRGWALLALGVLTGVALFAMAATELIAYWGGQPARAGPLALQDDQQRIDATVATWQRSSVTSPSLGETQWQIQASSA